MQRKSRNQGRHAKYLVGQAKVGAEGMHRSIELRYAADVEGVGSGEGLYPSVAYLGFQKEGPIFLTTSAYRKGATPDFPNFFYVKN